MATEPDSTMSLSNTFKSTEKILDAIEDSINSAAQMLISANVKDGTVMEEVDTIRRLNNAFPDLPPICTAAEASPTLTERDVETLKALTPLYCLTMPEVPSTGKYNLTPSEEKRLRRRMRRTLSVPPHLCDGAKKNSFITTDSLPTVSKVVNAALQTQPLPRQVRQGGWFEEIEKERHEEIKRCSADGDVLTICDDSIDYCSYPITTSLPTIVPSNDLSHSRDDSCAQPEYNLTLPDMRSVACLGAPPDTF